MYVIRVVMNLLTDVLCSSSQRFIGEYKPFICNQCGKKFMQKHNLVRPSILCYYILYLSLGLL